MNIVVLKGTHPIIKGTSQKYILTIKKINQHAKNSFKISTICI